jgi:hypothetical protein
VKPTVRIVQKCCRSLFLIKGQGFMRAKAILLSFCFLCGGGGLALSQEDPIPVQGGNENPLSGCMAPACHEGIEDIRNSPSKMMEGILKLGVKAGDPAGCVVCHGGNPGTEIKEEAHKGAPFFFS